MMKAAGAARLEEVGPGIRRILAVRVPPLHARSAQRSAGQFDQAARIVSDRGRHRLQEAIGVHRRAAAMELLVAADRRPGLWRDSEGTRGRLPRIRQQGGQPARRAVAGRTHARQPGLGRMAASNSSARTSSSTRRATKRCASSWAMPSTSSVSAGRPAFTMDSAGKTIDESFEISVRNRKKSAATVVVREYLYRWSTWKITAQEP